MKANELKNFVRAGADICMVVDDGTETGRVSFDAAAKFFKESNPNLLDNWLWRKISLVNQRGIQTYSPTSASYLFDGWTFTTANLSKTNATFTLQDDGVSFSITDQINALSTGLSKILECESRVE